MLHDDASQEPSSANITAGTSVLNISHNAVEQAEEPEEKDELTPEEIEALMELREIVRCVNFTKDELWACLVAKKIRVGYGDAGVYYDALLFNLNSEGTDSEFLPKSQSAVTKELERMLPLAPEYYCFCPIHQLVLKKSKAMVKSARCDSCKKVYDYEFANGQRQFTVFSIREQLQLYFTHGKLGRLVEKFEPIAKKLYGDREPYKTILKERGIILTVGVDAAPVTKKTGVSELPVLLTINNIPLGSHHRFPVMAALFCGQGPKPSSEMLLSGLRQEMVELEVKPITWLDHDGKPVTSKVYLLVASTDYVQKCELMQHIQGGYSGCPYCYYAGNEVSNISLLFYVV
jgi:hypothetical protein